MDHKTNPVLGALGILTMLYLSTPYVSKLSLIGSLDSLSAAFFVVAICQLIFLFPGRMAISFVGFFLVLAIAFNIASRQYFELQQYYPTVEAAYLLKEVWSLVAAYRIWQLSSLIILAVVGFIVLLVLAKIARPFSKRTRILSAIILLVVSIGFQWGYAATTSHSRFSVLDSVPIGHLIRSANVLPFANVDTETAVRYEREALARGLLSDPKKALPEKYSVEKLQGLLGYGPEYARRIEHPRFPFYKSSKPTPEVRENYNVIVLVLESVRASEMGIYGAIETATPFLDSLAAKATVAKKFYTTSNFTVKSEHAIHCSALDRMTGSPVAESPGELRTLCLPDLLAQVGYTSHWFHGNELAFYNRDEYLPKLGFDWIHDADVLNSDGSKAELGWGISDRDLVASVSTILASSKQPFYAEVLTLSNHLPFDYNWDIEFPDYLLADNSFHERYRRGIYYTDQAVKELYEAITDKGLLDNTILIITGDHGVWSFADDSLPGLHKNEQMFRVPFFIQVPDREPITINENHSHLDIAPTIKELLGLQIPDDFMGQSVFSTNSDKRKRVIYSMSESAMSLRLEDRMCIPSVQCSNSLECTAVHEQNISNLLCYDIPKDRDVLFEGDPILLSLETVKWGDRALFDFSQIAVEIGSFPNQVLD